MKRATMIAILFSLPLVGCGSDATVSFGNSDSTGSQADVSTAPDAPPPLPAQPPLSGPTALDPAGIAFFGFEDAALLTSLFADQIVLDLLAPSGPALDYTFLERLCLEGDDPDFYCHQRYGR